MNRFKYLNIAHEREMPLDERLKDQAFTHRALVKFLGLLAYLPKITFELEDVDQSIVNKLLKYEKELLIVDDWVFSTNYDLVDKLREIAPKLNSVSRPKIQPRYYRGFSVNPGQQTMGLVDKHWFFGESLKKNIAKGDVLISEVAKPMSFTSHIPTAEIYGNIIVSIDGRKHHRQMLHITREMIVALHQITEMNSKYYTTYDESILMPMDEPLEFRIDFLPKK